MKGLWQELFNSSPDLERAQAEKMLLQKETILAVLRVVDTLSVFLLLFGVLTYHLLLEPLFGTYILFNLGFKWIWLIIIGFLFLVFNMTSLLHLAHLRRAQLMVPDNEVDCVKSVRSSLRMKIVIVLATIAFSIAAYFYVWSLAETLEESEPTHHEISI